ncbi:hypothetical protein BU17DRAFT_72739 [Hysterangium stoloniferum]|nr:hypothetical protein BU17DRAFT_72739 [Hysterangium stoloniferum]
MTSSRIGCIRVLTFDDWLFHQGVDIHMGREVHALYEREESDWRAHMYKASLIQVFDGKRKAMNFLDIPTAVSLRPPDILPLLLKETSCSCRLAQFTQWMTLNDSLGGRGAFLRAKTLCIVILSWPARTSSKGFTDCNTEHPESEYILHALLETIPWNTAVLFP